MENLKIIELDTYRQSGMQATSEQPEDLGTAIQELIERMRANRSCLQKAN